MKVKDLLDSQEKWVPGHFAMDDEGNHIGAKENKGLTKFSFVGAIFQCYSIDERHKMNIWVKIKKHLGLEEHETITKWEVKGSTGYSDVLYLIDEFAL